MVFADLKGIFLGTRPSKVEHAAKTGWSGLSEPTLLVDDMSVHDSWVRRLEASAQDQRGFYQDGISSDLSSLWNENEVKRGRGRPRSSSIYFLRCVCPLLASRLRELIARIGDYLLPKRSAGLSEAIGSSRTDYSQDVFLLLASCRAHHPVDVVNLDLVSL
jgi:hypothetical protein